MSNIDWAVLCLTILGIVVYGLYKSRGQKNLQGYLLADKQLPWYHVGLSVMATQASAITFLSAPGQAFRDGMSFVQFYLGLPLAMIVLCIAFIPIYHKMNVYTAYEYLEKRFDVKTRTLTAILFLIQRGLSTGITIYAPSIVLSHILGIDIYYAIGVIGTLVILYTVYGGTKAVSYTQMIQMAIIFSGLFIAASMLLALLPDQIGLVQSMKIAGATGRMNVLNFDWDFNNKYTIWSGLIGGFFLQLSYFGTDQSQVGRYLTGSSVTQSRLGLLMNGIVKIPMQFFILFIGILVFVFYEVHPAPVNFNKAVVQKVEEKADKATLDGYMLNYNEAQEQKQVAAISFSKALESKDETLIAQTKSEYLTQYASAKNERLVVNDYMISLDDKLDFNDSNYVFLSFVTEHLPMGLVGLLIAIIFLASMGSTASGLNSLASTTVVDIYKRWFDKKGTDQNDLNISRWMTLFWGVFCVIVALNASKLGNLLEAVNILGSLFYGTILGIFLVAFFLKKVNGRQVFLAAALAEAIVVYCYKYDVVEYLWLNVVGSLSVMVIAGILAQLNLLKVKKAA
ncbi:MAG TPA: sodium:solute symporter [Chitinophagales bacterium]|nr:sodium:solute symporter [Chitinophagales bacterium]